MPRSRSVAPSVVAPSSSVKAGRGSASTVASTPRRAVVKKGAGGDDTTEGPGSPAVVAAVSGISGGVFFLLGVLALLLAGGGATARRTAPPAAPAPPPATAPPAAAPPAAAAAPPAPEPVAARYEALAPPCPALAAVLSRAGHFEGGGGGNGCPMEPPAPALLHARGWAGVVLNRGGQMHICDHTHSLPLPLCGSAFSWPAEALVKVDVGLSAAGAAAYKKWRMPALVAAARQAAAERGAAVEQPAQAWDEQAGAAFCELLLNTADGNTLPASFAAALPAGGVQEAFDGACGSAQGAAQLARKFLAGSE
jgi:hypothetical protein